VNVVLNGTSVLNFTYNIQMVGGVNQGDIALGLIARYGTASFYNLTIRGDDPAYAGGGTPQLATGLPPASSPVAPLTGAELTPVVQAAVKRWLMVDSSPTDAAALAGATVVIANLPSPMIGETIGNSIVIDPTAGGFGWFVDPTPLNDSEFADRIAPTELMAGPGSPAAGRMDLLTVVMHELGHVVGLNDVNTAAHPFDLMATDLAAGVRRLPDGSPASTPIAGAPVGSASGAFQVAAPPVTRTSEAQLANALDRSTAAPLFSLSRPSVIGLVP